MLKVYKEFAISGLGEQLDEFVSLVSDALPDYWEAAVHDKRDRYEYVVFTRPEIGGIPAAGLFLLRKPTTLELANIVPKSVHALSLDEYNKIAEEFAVSARPIASQLKLELTELGATSGLERWLSPRAKGALIAFSRAANKSTGSGHPLDFRRWARFITYSHRDKSSLPLDILVQYLVREENWEEDQADRLASQYEFGLNLLKEADDCD